MSWKFLLQLVVSICYAPTSASQSLHLSCPHYSAHLLLLWPRRKINAFQISLYFKLITYGILHSSFVRVLLLFLSMSSTLSNLHKTAHHSCPPCIQLTSLLTCTVDIVSVLLLRLVFHKITSHLSCCIISNAVSFSTPFFAKESWTADTQLREKRPLFSLSQVPHIYFP